MVTHTKLLCQRTIRVGNMIRPEPEIIVEQEDDGDYEND